MTSKIGIIAHSFSGTDIRRLTAHGSVFDVHEKVKMLRKVIIGAMRTGVDEIYYMPDGVNLFERAVVELMPRRSKFGWDPYDIDDFKDTQLNNIHISRLEMLRTDTYKDSVRAAKMMADLDIGCMITMGGDGTNRAVAMGLAMGRDEKGCREIPIIPLSTGTNNVFPFFLESTIAGMAAVAIAEKVVGKDSGAFIKTKMVNILKDGKYTDLALVDAVVLDEIFVGARALWDLSKVYEIITTRGTPDNIGMSSIAGFLHPFGLEEDRGLYIRLGPKGSKNIQRRVKAPFAPGLIDDAEIEEYRILELGSKIEITHKPSMFALDGEREFYISEEDNYEAQLLKNGPILVDVKKTMLQAVRKGFLDLHS